MVYTSQNNPKTQIEERKTKLELCCIGLGRKPGQQQCKMVGIEDGKHPGKLRKYQCCPVASSSGRSDKKKTSKLVKGVAFVGDEEDDEDCFTKEDDFVDDDDDDDDDKSQDDDDDDDPHDAPPKTKTPPSSSPARHDTTQTFEYVSDDDFVTDAGIHVASDPCKNLHFLSFLFSLCKTLTLVPFHITFSQTFEFDSWLLSVCLLFYL